MEEEYEKDNYGNGDEIRTILVLLILTLAMPVLPTIIVKPMIGDAERKKGKQ